MLRPLLRGAGTGPTGRVSTSTGERKMRRERSQLEIERKSRRERLLTEQGLDDLDRSPSGTRRPLDLPGEERGEVRQSSE